MHVCIIHTIIYVLKEVCPTEWGASSSTTSTRGRGRGRGRGVSQRGANSSRTGGGDGPRTRKCGHCRQEGHTRANCPNRFGD